MKMKHGPYLERCVTLLLSVTLLVGCAGVPGAGGATPTGSGALSTPTPGQRETITFQSLSFAGTLWSPLLPPSSEGTATTVSGMLTIPPSRGPVPAVIITHGCGGIGPSELGWARQLNQIGLATFVVQSFAGRQVSELCSGRHALNIASVLVDAYRALDLLAAHPRINPAQIAINAHEQAIRDVTTFLATLFPLSTSEQPQAGV